MAFLSIIIGVSLDRAADSIAVTVTANAGSSVLTECNKSLHDTFGVLALKNSVNHLSNLINYYIDNSIDGLNRFVHLKLNAAIVDTGESSDLYVSDFKKQISKLGLKSIVFKKTKETGLTDFTGSNLPSKTHGSGFGISAEGISELLQGKNIINKLSEGFGITEYVMNIFTDEEIEYLIFGNSSAEANKDSTRTLIFAIRCIIDGTEAIEDPLLIVKAIAQAWTETDEIMADPAQLQSYLRAMVTIMSESKKLAFRIMDIMQLTIGGDFCFEDYTYGFTVTAQFSRGNKNGTITQVHSCTE